MDYFDHPDCVYFSPSANIKDPAAKCDNDRAEILVFIKQLSKHSNFRWFSLMNIIQVCNCTQKVNIV